MELPDLVVPVREGPVNQQLRYALRSREANLPHRRVWIIGYRPPRLGGVGFIPTQRAGRTKYANTTLAMRHACRSTRQGRHVRHGTARVHAGPAPGAGP